VILLYLVLRESAKFSAGRRISRSKPIVAPPGRWRWARAADRITGALASSDQFVDALFHESGVIR
jgi:acyl-CoA synthetase (NDP forming)